MHIQIRSLFVVSVFAALLVTDSFAQDWPEFRGTDGTGSVTTDGILSRSSKVGLKIRWKKKLGSGYSSVVVSGDRIVTMYSDQTNDLVGCFSTTDGSEIWKVPVGKKFKGENGSFDGPISTPLIRDGKVYCFSPLGKLACLNLADGSEVWSCNVVERFKSRQPMYGFATSPILVGETLIIQAGAADNSVLGLDAATGEEKWASAKQKIDSQSPALVEIEGKQIVLAADGKNLAGVDPETGEVLFEHPHEGGNGSAMIPVVFDKNKVLLTLDDGFSTAFSVRKLDDAYQVSQEWKQRSIKNTYNVPVMHDGHLFAYSTRILTCVDSKTGAAKWKSRAPGDGFLIIVDGHVILNTKKGALHVLRATPDSYEEIAGLEVFDDLVWSLPAFSKDAIYMRSLGELACVELTSQTDIPSAEAKSKMGSKFSALMKLAASSDQPQQVVEEYLGGKEFPMVEGNLVHFIYQGDAKDVAVAGDMFGARQEKKMERIPNTDVWFQVTEVPDDVRLNYIFLVDYKPQTDPKNDRKATSSMYAGEMEFAVRLRGAPPLEMSWFGMPNWNEPDFIEASETASNLLEKKTVPSELLDAPHEIEVFVPRKLKSESSEDPVLHPVVYIYGPQAIKLGRLHEVAESICLNTSPQQSPIIVFFAGRPGPKYFESIATELVPFIDKNFNTVSDRNSRICMSNGMNAPMSLSLVANHNDIFGGAAVQTPLIFDAGQSQAIKEISEITQPTWIYLEWGKYDMFNPDENWDARKIGNVLATEFRKSKHVQVLGGEVPDSTDWSSWRNRFDKVLNLFELMKNSTQD